MTVLSEPTDHQKFLKKMIIFWLKRVKLVLLSLKKKRWKWDLR